MFSNIWQLQKELDELFGQDLFPRTTYGRGVFPAINVFEKDDEIMVKAEIPGVDKKDIEIQVVGDVVKLSGERKKRNTEDAHFHRQEITSGKFMRQFKLPYRVDGEKVSAELSDGILTMKMEKEASVKPRQISIK